MTLCLVLGIFNLFVGIVMNNKISSINYFASGFSFAFALAIAAKTGVLG